jgi:hypothetical protein
MRMAVIPLEVATTENLHIELCNFSMKSKSLNSVCRRVGLNQEGWINISDNAGLFAHDE